MNNYFTRIFADLAKHNGYNDIHSLLSDYGLFPSVLMPKHRKREFITLILKSLKANK